MHPHVEKTLFQFCIIGDINKILEELFETFLLFFREEISVVKLMDVLDIFKNLIRISHILVNIIKISNQQLSPTEKVIQCLIRTGLL